MKKYLLILLSLVLILTMGLTACQKREHKCESVCPICGKCTDSTCSFSVCAEKCQGHESAHVCGHICPECGKCTDLECEDPICAEKCQGHDIAVTSIAIDGEEYVMAQQGDTVTVSVSVLPADATVATYALTVETTNMSEGDYALANGILTIGEDAVGYIVIKATSDSDSTLSDRLVVTVNDEVALSQYHIVTFKNASGEIVDVQAVANGESAVAPDYKKDGYKITWDKTLDNITQDTVITAVEEQQLYEVSYWYIVEGEPVQIGTTQYIDIDSGEKAIAPSAPELVGHTFLDWQYAIDGYVVSCTAVYTAE